MTNYTIWWHVGDQPTQEIKIAIDAEVLPEYCAIIDGELEETAEHLVRRSCLLCMDTALAEMRRLKQ